MWGLLSDPTMERCGRQGAKALNGGINICGKEGIGVYVSVCVSVCACVCVLNDE